MSKPRLILVSGWGTDERAMFPLRRVVAPRFACEYVPWWKCMGEENALGARLATHEERAIIVGWSLGCQIALKAAAAQPDRVRALVLVSGTARMTADEGYGGVPLRVLRSMRAKFKTAPREVLRDFGALCLAPLKNGPWVDEFVRIATEIDAAHGCLGPGLRYLQDTDVRCILPEIRVPSLVVHGEADQIVPIESARFMAGALPESQWHAVPEGSHAMLYTDPTSIEPEIGRFLDVHSPL